VILLDDGRVKADGDAESTIETYLSTMDGSGPQFGEVVFGPEGVAAGGPVTLHAIRTKDSDGRIRGDFRSAEEIVVEFDFTRLEPVDYLRIGFDLVTTRGAIVFRTFHNDLAEPLRDDCFGSLERLQATVPAGLLTGGVYQIRPCIRRQRRGSDWILHDVAGPSIHVMLNIPNPDYADSERAGVVTPLIEWRSA
jgi:hypothetical protein